MQTKPIEEMTLEEKVEWVAMTVHLGLVNKGYDGMQSAAFRVVDNLQRDAYRRGRLEAARMCMDYGERKGKDIAQLIRPR